MTLAVLQFVMMLIGVCIGQIGLNILRPLGLIPLEYQHLPPLQQLRLADDCDSVYLVSDSESDDG